MVVISERWRVLLQRGKNLSFKSADDVGDSPVIPSPSGSLAN